MNLSFYLFELFETLMSSMILTWFVMVASGIMLFEGNHELTFKQEIISEVAQIMLAPIYANFDVDNSS